ncbi:MAG: molybdenum cofactor guanylyltransferase [Ignavibacteria bacterium]|nr:molybdenum cofactor guanylyltransferase [Ignavibacteria bacterium]
MGANKALLPLNGKTIIEHIASLAKSIFANVILITNHPEEYSFLGLDMFKDIYQGKGPLAGIHSGLNNSKTEKNFILSCDIPLINKEIIEFLLKYNTTHPVTVIKADGFVQHLCGVYGRSLKMYAEEILLQMDNGIQTGKKGKCKMTELLNSKGAEIIDCRDIPYYYEGMFLNINRPFDYQTLLEQNK